MFKPIEPRTEPFDEKRTNAERAYNIAFREALVAGMGGSDAKAWATDAFDEKMKEK